MINDTFSLCELCTIKTSMETSAAPLTKFFEDAHPQFRDQMRRSSPRMSLGIQSTAKFEYYTPEWVIQVWRSTYQIGAETSLNSSHLFVAPAICYFKPRCHFCFCHDFSDFNARHMNWVRLANLQRTQHLLLKRSLPDYLRAPSANSAKTMASFPRLYWMIIQYRKHGQRKRDQEILRK